MFRTIFLAMLFAGVVILCMHHRFAANNVEPVGVPATVVRRVSYESENTPAVDDWRRTTLGWERKSEWNLPTQSDEPLANKLATAKRLHPSLVAFFVLAVSIGALLMQTQPLVSWCWHFAVQRVDRR